MSTTIHVVIPDHAEALGVVATLLNQGYQVSIDLDVVAEPKRAPRMTKPIIDARKTKAEPLEIMDTATVKLHDQLWGPNSEAARNLERLEREGRHQVTVYGAKLGRDENGYYVNGLKVSQADFDAEIRKRMQARDERAEIALHAIEATSCPTCKADVGQRCITRNGNRYGKQQVHLERELKLNRMRRDSATPVAK